MNPNQDNTDTSHHSGNPQRRNLCEIPFVDSDETDLPRASPLPPDVQQSAPITNNIATVNGSEQRPFFAQATTSQAGLFPASADDNNSERRLLKIKCLNDKLRQARHQSTCPTFSSDPAQSGVTSYYYIPKSDLNRIIDYHSIRNEFEKLNLYHEPELTARVQNVRGASSLQTIKDKSIASGGEDATDDQDLLSLSPVGVELPTRQKIFAILVLLDKVSTITQLIDEGISDNDLPFEEDGDRLFRKKDGDSIPIAAFQTWSPFERDMFFNYQWYMLAPYLVLASDEEPKARKESFHVRMPLPFVVHQNVMEDNVDFIGGFSQVQMVTIHPAHYSQGDHEEEKNNVFAVKTLRKFSPKNYEAECDALLKFAERKHPHLIRLLLGFTHGAIHSFIFPLATSNLQRFWMQNTPDVGSTDRIKWMAGQFFGLTDALKLIHTPYHDEKNIRGRHGDLKPENILWFQDIGSPEGILKIADFGLASFHREESYRESGSRAGRSATYRSPEHDMGKVTPASDLWSLGCILLQFIVWHYGGWGRVDLFSTTRLKEEEGTDPFLREDKFFRQSSFIPMRLRTSSRLVLKTSVKEEISKLRDEGSCSGFLCDVLKLIERNLLRVCPKDRSNSEAIQNSFRLLNEKCGEEVYCNRGTLKVLPTRSSIFTNLSTRISPLLSLRRKFASNSSLTTDIP